MMEDQVWAGVWGWEDMEMENGMKLLQEGNQWWEVVRNEFDTM